MEQHYFLHVDVHFREPLVVNVNVLTDSAALSALTKDIQAHAAELKAAAGESAAPAASS